MRSGYDEYSESGEWYIDDKAASRAVETGRYFVQFLLYVVVSYCAMLVRFIRNKGDAKGGQPPRGSS